MNLNKKTALLLFSGIIFFQSLSWAQSFDLITLRQQFLSYTNRRFQEKLFVHTDKGLYMAGEIVWFKLYAVNAANLKPDQLSKLAYVELLDQQNRPVQQGKIGIGSSGGDGSFYLPVTIESGYYTLRAYTSWMKNFGEEVFFEKRITIINTLRTAPEYKKDTSQPVIDFFPEGGNLVSHIKSRVGFKLTDQSGRGLSGTGIILNASGDTIVQFHTERFGMGSFELEPAAGDYTAVVRSADGKLISKLLPKTYQDGYVLSVNENGPDKINVSLRTSGTAGQRTREIFLVVHSRQEIRLAEKALVNNDNRAEFSIDRNQIGKGVVHFSIFNRDGQPVCERLYFSGPVPELPATIKTTANDYKGRSKVDVQMNANTGGGSLSAFHASVSVSLFDSLDWNDQVDIRAYYWLTSELPGYVESPSYYFSADAGVKAAMENLMLTQGWRRFKWEDVLKEQKPVIRYVPEFKGHIITVRVTTAEGNRPGRKVDTYLSIPSASTNFYVAESDSNGIAYFDVKEYYRVGEIYAQVLNRRDSAFRVAIMSPFYEDQKAGLPAKLSIRSADGEAISNRNIGMQVQNIYSADSIQRFQPAFIKDTLPFFGKAEFSYLLDNYTRFTTMEEILREYVTPVNVYMQGGKPHLKVFNFLKNEFYEQDVLVLLDGIPLKDRNSIFDYDPAKIKRLDVIPQSYILGTSRFNAVLNFSTYDRVFDGYELNPSSIAIDYEGLQLQRKFYSPLYLTAEQLKSKLPDFRSTLYWSPGVEVDEKGNASFSFFSSDQAGDYRILLQGISGDGRTIVTQTRLTVKKK